MKKLIVCLMLFSGQAILNQAGAQEKMVKDSCVFFIKNNLDWNHDEKLEINASCRFSTFGFKLYSRWGEVMYETNMYSGVFDLELQQKIGKGKNERYKYMRTNVYLWEMNFQWEGEENKPAQVRRGQISIL